MVRVKSSRRKFKRLICRIFFVVLIACVTVQLVNVHINISQKQRELNSLREKVDVQIQQNQMLQKQLDFGITDEYIAKIAREKLNLVLPSERIFVDIARE